jgi:hypothetical protein
MITSVPTRNPASRAGSHGAQWEPGFNKGVDDEESCIGLGVTLAALAFANEAAHAQSCTSYQTTGPYYATPSGIRNWCIFQRFICLPGWNKEAVLDRETGLVWQRTPEDPSGTGPFEKAVLSCYNSRTGGRCPRATPFSRFPRTRIIGMSRPSFPRRSCRLLGSDMFSPLAAASYLPPLRMVRLSGSGASGVARTS